MRKAEAATTIFTLATLVLVVLLFFRPVPAPTVLTETSILTIATTETATQNLTSFILVTTTSVSTMTLNQTTTATTTSIQTTTQTVTQSRTITQTQTVTQTTTVTSCEERDCD